jgi:hypothetical protein
MQTDVSQLVTERAERTVTNSLAVTHLTMLSATEVCKEEGDCLHISHSVLSTYRVP